MSNLSNRIASLPPEKRRLLEQRLLQTRAHDAPGGGAGVLDGERPRAQEPWVPLSFAQQRLWFLYQLDPTSAFYNVPAALRLSGYLRTDALKQALDALIERHEALRTVFRVVDGEPRQVIAPAHPVTLEILDLRHLQDAEEEAHRRVMLEATRPFDLQVGPLFRASVIRFSAQDFHLLLTFHHIIVDGWSISILLEELGALYQAFSLGQPSPLGAPPPQYSDFTRWQRQFLRGETLDRLLSWWKGQLRDAPPPTILPAERPPSSRRGFRGASLHFSIPRGVTAALKDLAQHENATLFMTLLTLFKVLLHRYSGEDDIVIGTPIANRTRAEFERTVGFFTNTLVIRSDLSGNLTFREALRRVREATLGCYAHQDLPFERLVEELRPDRSQSLNPLFQVMFALQEAQGQKQKSGTGDKTSGPSGTAKFDFTLFLTESDQGLSGIMEFSTEVFEEATISGVAEAYRQLAAAVAREPDARVRRLPMLSAEQERRLQEWQSGPRRPLDARRLDELVTRQAARRPEALAVCDARDRLTYGELDRRVNQLARHLRTLGVVPGRVVGVSLERGCDAVLAFLAISRAGGVYLPLDVEYPPERIASMAQDAGMSVLLTRSSELERARAAIAVSDRLEMLLMDDEAVRMAEGGPVECLAGERDLAYCIFTSGSTGRPKGILVEHAGLCNVADSAGEVFALEAGERMLQFASLAFDASLLEMAIAFRCGASLHVIPREARVPGPEFLRYVREQQITAALLPPSFVAELRPESLPRLLTLIVGGEACSEKVASEWSQGRRLFNAYGPTETSIWATVDSEMDGSGPVTIGRPIGNLRIHVLDRDLQPVPPGAVGELCIGGVGVSRGYLGRPELSAAQFVPDPFSREPGARIYRSGDLARFRPDGRLQLLGRRDRQVKLRGFRVELGEIEAVLNRHPAVASSVVRLRQRAGLGARLVAWVVPSSGHELDVEAIRGHARQSLPEHLIPAAVVPLRSVPLNRSGKVSDEALPEPPQESGRDASAPSTPTEATLAEIFGSLLGIDKVGRLDSFFQLGGHSLLATRAVSRIRDRLAVELEMRAFFDAPNVAALASLIDDRRSHASPSPSFNQSITRAPREAKRIKRPPPHKESDSSPRRDGSMSKEETRAPQEKAAQPTPNRSEAFQRAYEQLMNSLRADYYKAEEHALTAMRAFQQQASPTAQEKSPEQAYREALERYCGTIAEAGGSARQAMQSSFGRYMQAIREAWGQGEAGAMDVQTAAALAQHLQAASWWTSWMMSLLPQQSR